MRRFGSFSDGLRHMLHLLRRARPGAQGEGRREAQAQPVCFVLHDFENFALRPKQVYSILYYSTILFYTARLRGVRAPARAGGLARRASALSAHFPHFSHSLPPPPPQTCLYSLLDLCQTDDALLVVVGARVLRARVRDSADAGAALRYVRPREILRD